MGQIQDLAGRVDNHEKRLKKIEAMIAEAEGHQSAAEEADALLGETESQKPETSTTTESDLSASTVSGETQVEGTNSGSDTDEAHG